MHRFGGLEKDSWLQSLHAMLAGGVATLGLLKSVEQAAASVAFAALAPPSAFAVVVPGSSDSTWVHMHCTSGGCGQSYPHGDDAGSKDSNNGNPNDDFNREGSCLEHSRGQKCPDIANQGAQISLSGRYIEDCRLSQPSSEARSPEAAAALWQVTQELLVTRLLTRTDDNTWDNSSEFQ